MRILILTVIGAMLFNYVKAPILDVYTAKLFKDSVNYTIKQNRINEQSEEFNRFLNHLALRESSGDWKIYNKWGYIGLYQMGSAARIDTGYGHVTFSSFINNPYIFPAENQKEAVIRLMSINIDRMKPYTDKYYLIYYDLDGTEINGTKLTLSGMIAGAHLAGAYNMIRYIKSDGKFNPRDALGTSLSDYVKEFSDYNFKSNLTNYE